MSRTAEQAVLGALLAFPDYPGISKVFEVLSAECFSDERHRAVFGLLEEEVRQSGELPSRKEVRDRLERAGTLENAGGAGYLDSLAGFAPTGVDWGYQARVVQGAWARRQLRRIGELDPDGKRDIVSLLREADAILARVQLPREVHRPTRCKEFLWPTLERLEDEQHRELGANRIRTGIPELDDVLFGLAKGQVSLISGFRGIGKTTLAMTAAIAAAEQGEPTLVVTGDHDGRQLTSRALAVRSGLPVWKLESPVRDRLREGEYLPLARAAGLLSGAPLYFTGGVAPILASLRTIMRDCEGTRKFSVLVIDGCDTHLGPDAESFMHGLRALAEETGTAILVTLAVDIDDRLVRVPSSPDLRPAALEADTVIRLSETCAADGRRRTGDRHVHVVVEWHRYGTPGECDLLFRERLTCFGRPLPWNTSGVSSEVVH